MPKACRRDRGLCLRNACYMHARTLWPRTPAHQTPCFRHVYAHMYASRQISAPVSLPPLPPSPSVFPQACSFGCVHAGAAGHAGVTADLQVPGWAARCLLARGFDPRAPTAWVLEGLLYYLQPSTVPVLLQVRHVGGACSGAAAGAASGAWLGVAFAQRGACVLSSKHMLSAAHGLMLSWLALPASCTTYGPYSRPPHALPHARLRGLANS